jgi:hypothetical protein
MAYNATAYGTGADLDAAGLRKRTAGEASAHTPLLSEEDEKKNLKSVGSLNALLAV